MMEIVPRNYTPDQVAVILTIDVKTVYEWAKKRILPAIPMGRAVRFPIALIDELAVTGIPASMTARRAAPRGPGRPKKR